MKSNLKFIRSLLIIKLNINLKVINQKYNYDNIVKINI